MGLNHILNEIIVVYPDSVVTKDSCLHLTKKSLWLSKFCFTCKDFSKRFDGVDLLFHYCP